jgi:hypothetical protein
MEERTMTRKLCALNTAILQFIAQCVVEGDEDTLVELGLDRHDAGRIADLHLGDLDLVDGAAFPILRKAAIDRDLVHRLIGRVHALREGNRIRDALLCRDAPFPLMQQCYGMDAAEYAERGWRLRVRRQNGRPAEPSEVDDAAVWQAYKLLPPIEGPGIRAEDWLSLCETTGLSARVVWTAVQRLTANATQTRTHV